MISHLTQTGRAQQTTGVQQTTAAQDAALARGQERISRLTDGQTLQGKVLSVSSDADGGRTAQVDLGGGAVINARISGNMALSSGQDISFSVKSGADNTTAVTLRPLYANTSADLSGMKALSQAGLDATPDATAMVREMMSEGMSIDRSALLSMNRGVMAYPGHAVSVVQMTSLGIPLSPENIEQFENYKNFEHQVTGTIDSIMEELPDAFREMNASGNNKGALDLYGDLLKLFGSGQDVPADGTGSTAPGATTVFSEDTLLGEGNAAAKPAPDIPNTATEKTATQKAQSSPLPEGTVPNAGQALLDAIGKANADSSVSAPATDKGASDVLEAAMKALAEAGKTSETSSEALPARTQQFTDLLRALHIPEEVITNAQNGGSENSAQTELMRALADAWQKTGHSDAKTDSLWTKLFSSREMGGLLKDAIARDWLLKPSDVAQKDHVQNLYDRLQNQTKTLTQILSGGSGATATHLSESVQQLQNNLNFMNDLNHMFQYVQLPLKMNGQNTHGDLYVYTNKKNAMHEDGTVSAVLHLDMEHMGPVDVFVKMRDNNVKTNFYLADDEMIDFLMAHIDILNKRLEKRGYNMEAKMHLQEEEMIDEDAPVREMLNGNLGRISTLSHTAFDALA
ncbi:MAG: flagellar hook-length control protein FliK [Lachnospiraceae bacterium]|nr:flagellar hook-length control protein FliK [Lachnospiraceae bacterium]